MKGVDIWIRSNYRPNQSISIKVMKLLMDKVEVVVKGKVSMLERSSLTKNGPYFRSCFVESLRGSEGFMMDASGFWHHVWKGREGTIDHVVIPLKDRLDEDTGIRHYLNHR